MAHDEINDLREKLEQSVKTQERMDLSQASDGTTLEHVKGTLT
jgi:hypothetical protein